MKQILVEDGGLGDVRRLVGEVSAKADTILCLQTQELRRSQLDAQGDAERALEEVRAQIRALQSQSAQQARRQQIGPGESE